MNFFVWLLVSFALPVTKKKNIYIYMSGLFSSGSRFFKEGKYPVSGIDDKEFNEARKCLEARRKQLKNKANEKNRYQGKKTFRA